MEKMEKMVCKVLVMLSTTQNPYIWNSSKDFLSICCMIRSLPPLQGKQEHCRLVRPLWATTWSAELCGHFFHFHDQSLGSLSWGVITSCFLFPKCHSWIGKSRNWWGCRNLEHLERGLRPFFLDWEILQGGTCSTKQKHPSGWFLGVSSSLLSIWKINSQPQRRKYEDLLV